MTETSLTLTSHSAAETAALGVRVGRALTPGVVIILRGEVGAGKTTFVAGLARGLGLKVKARSPSFALVHIHGPLVHADLYRVAAADTPTLGLDDYLDGRHIIAVEWGDRAAPATWKGAPTALIRMEITGAEERRLTLIAAPPTGPWRTIWEEARCESSR